MFRFSGLNRVHTLSSVLSQARLPHYRRISSRRSLEPQLPTSARYDLIDSSILLEEESIPNYRPQRFFPVEIGLIFNDRYRVVGKLGYGASSTVWLCWDLNSRDYVALKVYSNSPREYRELPIYQHIAKVQSKHPGRQCLRPVLDSFEAAGPHGRHFCLVHPPLGMSLYELKMRARGKVFTKDVLRPCIRQLLAAVDYLHKDAHIIHTDLQPNNLLMGLDDKSVLSQYEKAEVEHPVLRKVLSDRTIYPSRPLPFTFGPPLLCDLGEARLGDYEHQDDIMPDVYRVPEVLLGMKWGYKVDIWAVAMVVWDLFEPEYLFDARVTQGQYDDASHLAQMIAVLGPPPLDFLTRSNNYLQYWDVNGNWRGLAPIPDISLEGLEKRLTGNDKEAFLTFLRQMLCWKPEERPSAGEIIYDPWVLEDLFNSNDG
ncbi:hypothetical protein LOZ12_005829 [Ophidiomyces ophidiicola]|uniref:Uncharacterized protein n=1 Tax=Ophidiomyces ophidiicola TaxID=1387563 RepID=A0ACB8UW96_9EURO|nr:hypothetical protein LOZ62_001683 [Ophidiomyces ophidiicola]KAI1956636.1 hypothetical protein LOZ59_004238 [Ophidiomyces ophidiicola]KAI1972391.1 hypothetical protein LOZ56_002436 [Ophidiomyces ophidiicola]KAI2024107.1 hypothetical protein LOZ45_003699 [Ophidiomyces ophidiicola]KAI2039432.1 hypothetical protein LOZ47_002217 [Ophidiomyces ophidiicola]